MSDSVIDEAYAYLRGHTTADIRFDEHFRPIKYVIAPNGRLVAPAMVAMLQSVDTVLFVPEVREDAMEVQVTLHPLDEAGPGGALADRWRIHHGDPPDVNWAEMIIDAARYHRHVLDGEPLTRTNPLAELEPGLCRRVNQERRDDLRGLVRRVAGVQVESPMMVAIDPGGLDVRAKFDVIRVPAAAPMSDTETAERVVAAMLEDAQLSID